MEYVVKIFLNYFLLAKSIKNIDMFKWLTQNSTLQPYKL